MGQAIRDSMKQTTDKDADAADQTRESGSEVPPHYLRILAYCVAAATFIVGMYNGLYEQTETYIIGGIALLFPVTTHVLSAPLRDTYPEQTSALLLILDSFMAGLAIVLAKFSLVPAAMFAIVTSASVMTVIGVRGWLVSMVSLGIGAVVGLILFGHELHLATPPTVAAISMLGVFIYISVTGFYAHNQTLVLLKAQEALLAQQEKAERLARKMAKYLSPQVWGSIFSGRKDVKLETQRKKLTIFFSDIKGFSEISEELQPEALTDLLNNYFTEMSRIATRYGGTIDKFIGDAIMIFFGDPNSQGVKKDAMACVSMAIEMRKQMKVMRQQWIRKGVTKPLQIRMGINTGYCTVGNFGAESRMDYTIIGKEVNLASRLESVAEPGQIFLSNETHSMVKDSIMCRDKGSLSVKGFSKPVPIYEVVGFRKDLGAQNSFVEEEFDGFSMYLDIDAIKNYDKENILKALQGASERVKNKIVL